MPTLKDHALGRPVKLLILGDSGSGKTGSLASLVNAGQRVIVQDYDNGLDVLVAYVGSDVLDNLYYVTLTDKMKSSPWGAIPAGTPDAVARGLRLLDNWTDGEIKLGGISKWGLDTTFVLDSLTFMGEAAMRFVRFSNGRKPEEASWISDWGQAMGMQESFLELLYSDAVKCNVIVTSHIVFPPPPEKKDKNVPKTAVEEETQKGVCSALGRQLPPRVPRYFNNMVRAVTIGGGRRIFRTTSTEALELKNSRPDKIPRELPLGTGLADLFKIIHGEVVRYEP